MSEQLLRDQITTLRDQFERYVSLLTQFLCYKAEHSEMEEFLEEESKEKDKQIIQLRLQQQSSGKSANEIDFQNLKTELASLRIKNKENDLELEYQREKFEEQIVELKGKHKHELNELKSEMVELVQSYEKLQKADIICLTCSKASQQLQDQQLKTSEQAQIIQVMSTKIDEQLKHIESLQLGLLDQKLFLKIHKYNRKTTIDLQSECDTRAESCRLLHDSQMSQGKEELKQYENLSQQQNSRILQLTIIDEEQKKEINEFVSASQSLQSNHDQLQQEVLRLNEEINKYELQFQQQKSEISSSTRIDEEQKIQTNIFAGGSQSVQSNHVQLQKELLQMSEELTKNKELQLQQKSNILHLTLIDQEQKTQINEFARGSQLLQSNHDALKKKVLRLDEKLIEQERLSQQQKSEILHLEGTQERQKTQIIQFARDKQLHQSNYDLLQKEVIQLREELIQYRKNKPPQQLAQKLHPSEEKEMENNQNSPLVAGQNHQRWNKEVEIIISESVEQPQIQIKTSTKSVYVQTNAAIQDGVYEKKLEDQLELHATQMEFFQSKYQQLSQDNQTLFDDFVNGRRELEDQIYQQQKQFLEDKEILHQQISSLQFQINQSQNFKSYLNPQQKSPNKNRSLSPNRSASLLRSNSVGSKTNKIRSYLYIRVPKSGQGSYIEFSLTQLKLIRIIKGSFDKSQFSMQHFDEIFIDNYSLPALESSLVIINGASKTGKKFIMKTMCDQMIEYVKLLSVPQRSTLNLWVRYQEKCPKMSGQNSVIFEESQSVTNQDQTIKLQEFAERIQLIRNHLSHHQTSPIKKQGSDMIRILELSVQGLLSCTIVSTNALAVSQAPLSMRGIVKQLTQQSVQDWQQIVVFSTIHPTLLNYQSTCDTLHIIKTLKCSGEHSLEDLRAQIDQQARSHSIMVQQLQVLMSDMRNQSTLKQSKDKARQVITKSERHSVVFLERAINNLDQIINRSLPEAGSSLLSRVYKK